MTTQDRHETEKLLTPAEVAALFRVDPKTVTRWAKAGKLTSIRTLGGHRRYRESEVRGLLGGQLTAAAAGGSTPQRGRGADWCPSPVAPVEMCARSRPTSLRRRPTVLR